MIGVSLSRWTMSYFAAALLALLLSELLMAAGFGFPAAPVEAPETLFLVHLVMLGWLSLLMCGALLQFLPVLIAEPLHDNGLPLPALILLLLGIISLLCAFLQMGGHIGFDVPFFASAATLLSLGFLLVLYDLARTLIAARSIPLPAHFVVVGLISVVFAVSLGAIFALVLGGQADAAPLQALLTVGLPVHVIAGLLGWLTFTAVGVSYRLLAMFMLAPESDRATTRTAFWLGSLALALAIVGGIIAVEAGWNLAAVLLGAFVAALVAAVCYGVDMRHLFRARRRPRIELNSRMAAFALSSLAAVVVLAVGLLALGRFTDHVGALVFLTAFGWLSGLGLAQLYKIVAFLTWLECYGPVMGKTKTPRVQDLVVEPRARRWFWLYFAAVWVGTVLLLAGWSDLFRLAAAAMLVGTAGLVWEFLRTRRLLDVASGAAFERLPAGTTQPKLLRCSRS